MYNLTPEQLGNYNDAPASINAGLPALFTNAGIVTNPDYLQFIQPDNGGLDPAEPLDDLYGGSNPALVVNDLLALGLRDELRPAAQHQHAGNPALPLASTAVEPGASTAVEIGQVFDPATFDLSGLFGDLDASAFDLSALFGGLDPTSLDLSALFGGIDTTAMSAEFANLLEDLTAALVPDFATSALTAF